MKLSYNRYSLTLFLIAALVLSCFSLVGCGKKDDLSSESKPTTIATAPPLLDVDITKLISSDKVGSALGVTVGEGLVTDEDTTVRFYSEDSISYSEISLMESGRDIYDSTVALYTDAVDTMNLGQAAKWSAEQKQLLVYTGKYILSVTADVADKSDDDLVVSARQIAALILEKL